MRMDARRRVVPQLEASTQVGFRLGQRLLRFKARAKLDCITMGECLGRSRTTTVDQSAAAHETE